jgi:hypothetical protein
LTETGFVVWRADVDTAVVAVEASPASAGDPDAVDLMRFPCPVLLVRSASGAEHLLIGDRKSNVRLDVVSGTVHEGPVRLRYGLVQATEIEAKLLTIRRLAALIRLGRFPRKLFPPARQARKWMIALRALDARRAGATHREIAVALFGDSAVGTDWNGGSGYLRCRIQRLIRLGETLTKDYRRLLR